MKVLCASLAFALNLGFAAHANIIGTSTFYRYEYDSNTVCKIPPSFTDLYDVGDCVTFGGNSVTDETTASGTYLGLKIVCAPVPSITGYSDALCATPVTPGIAITDCFGDSVAVKSYSFICGTGSPTNSPSRNPTGHPSKSPSRTPSKTPSASPTTSRPSKSPTKTPTRTPTTNQPTKSPTKTPTRTPTTNQPSKSPTTSRPSKNPTRTPTTLSPSKSPTVFSTKSPTRSPSKAPTNTPTAAPVVASCRPENGVNLNECTTLKKYCKTFGIKMKWGGEGCTTSTGQKVGDGGCQCNDYCGYTCEASCRHDKQCKWNAQYQLCYTKTGEIGVPIPQCTTTD